MHAIGVIVQRNAYAAGREAAHARLEGDMPTCADIWRAHDDNHEPDREFLRGWKEGLNDE